MDIRPEVAKRREAARETYHEMRDKHAHRRLDPYTYAEGAAWDAELSPLKAEYAFWLAVQAELDALDRLIRELDVG